MLRTACIRLDVKVEQSKQLSVLREVYADACNRLVSVVCEHRIWNRVGLHNMVYRDLREHTPLEARCAATLFFCL